MSHLFKIEEHVVPCQHIREYRRATADTNEDVLQLHIKQYTPWTNLEPRSGDVTIIGGHGNGFVKVGCPPRELSIFERSGLNSMQELYEPLWDEILSLAPENGFCIRSIWMADVAWQGQSSVLNEDLLGNDPNGHDHARDLLHFINLKRDQIPQPVFGVGHSMGGCQLTKLALLHPRLFYTLVLLDPVIEYNLSKIEVENKRKLVSASTFRRDFWLSREAAKTSVQGSPLFSAWEPRVQERLIKYSLRSIPTALYASSPDHDATAEPVTLTTTKHQEVFTFIRPNYNFDQSTDNPLNLDRTTHADLDTSDPNTKPFYRPESSDVIRHLPELRPSVLYILGGTSDVLPNLAQREQRTNQTGTEIGGSGGVPVGRVECLTLGGCGHLFPMENVKKAATPTAGWLGKEFKRWSTEEQKFRKEWNSKSKIQKATVDQQWLDMIGPDPRKKKTAAQKL